MRALRPLSLNAAWLALPAAFLLAALGVPLWLVLRAVSLESVVWVLGVPPWSGFVRDRIWVDLQQAAASTALALAAAIPLALLHRRAIPGRRFLQALHAAPFVLPVFVVVYGLQGTVGPTGLGWAWSPFAAVVVANAYYNYGFASRLLSTAFERRPVQLEDVARTLGASPWHVTRRITWPLLSPSILGVALLVSLFCLASFGVVLLLGAGEVSTLETLIYQNLRGAFPAEDHAAALGIVQIMLNAGLAIGIVAAARRTTRLPAARAPHLPARLWHTVLAWSLAAVAATPILTVLVGGFRVQGVWTLETWRSLLDATHPAHRGGFDLFLALRNSATYAAGAVTISLLLVLVLAYAGRRLATGRRVAEVLATIPLGTSFFLTGFGLVLAYGASGVLDLRGQPLLIWAAHALVITPLLARVLLPVITQFDLRVEEQAASLGASPVQVWMRTHLPALRRPLLVAVSLGAALSLSDLGASLLLAPGSDVAGLAVWIDQHDRPFDLFAHSQAVALAGLLGAITLTLYAAADRAGGRL